MSIRWSRSPWVASLLIAILASPNEDPLHAQAPAATPAAAKTTAPAPVTPPPGTNADTGWPRTLQMQNGTLVWFQPQVESWTDRKKIVAWSAVAYTPLTATQAALGTIKIEGDTKVSVDEAVVSLDMKVTQYNFPTLSSVQVRAMVSEVETLPVRQRVLDLDRLLAYVADSPLQAKTVEGLKVDPPMIYQATGPAILLNLEGEPIWSPIKDLDLRYVLNTNWDLFEYGPTKMLYLRHEKSWVQATKIDGPWEIVKKLPDSFKKLPDDGNWVDVKAAVPGKKFTDKTLPKVFVSLEPAELIVINGPIDYKPVVGAGDLLWVSNTEADVFRYGKMGDFYFLVAGRWFKSGSLAGPWTFATPTLPAEFKKIPIEHERSRVLVSVPGTPQANEAIQLASIPRTARVNKRDTKAPEVTYNGAGPEFKTIEGANGLQYAVNTDKDIIKFGDLYYMCFQGVWFMAKAATGPWEVASTVPKEIYTIPASSPVNHVTYVTVEEDDDDEWVTFAYVAAYTGMMIGYGCVMWGTGWYYPPYYGGGIYYPYPHTYGMGAWYNPYTGAYGRGYGAYGPYGGVGMGAAYNPRTGTYARGATAYGPYGSRSYAQAYNPRTGSYGQTRQGSNVYGNWGSSSVQRGDSWAQTAHVDNYAKGTSTSAARTSAGGAAVSRSQGGSQTSVARTAGGDVYAGRDGNVYRKTDAGGWEQANGSGGWSPVSGGGGDRPGQLPSGGAGDGAAGGANRPTQQPAASTRPANTSSTSQLDRDSAARSAGNQRTTTRSTQQSSGGMSRSSSGSFGGGARMGGGGGRRR